MNLRLNASAKNIPSYLLYCSQSRVGLNSSPYTIISRLSDKTKARRDHPEGDNQYFLKEMEKKESASKDHSVNRNCCRDVSGDKSRGKQQVEII